MTSYSWIVLGVILIIFGLVHTARALWAAKKGEYVPLSFLPFIGKRCIKRNNETRRMGATCLLFCKETKIRRSGEFPIREISSNFFNAYICCKILIGLAFIVFGCYLIYLGL